MYKNFSFKGEEILKKLKTKWRSNHVLYKRMYWI